VPVSVATLSRTFSTQVPFELSPANALRGLAGLKLPVYGAPAIVTFWMLLTAESSNTVWQKLLPLLEPPPALLRRVTFVPAGDCSVAVRSPIQVCASPTVVEPIAVLQLVPSNENPTCDRDDPEIASGMSTPTGLLSGIGTGAPVYEVVTLAPGLPVCTGTMNTVGLPPTPVNATLNVNRIRVPQGTVELTVNVNGVVFVAEPPAGMLG